MLECGTTATVAVVQGHRLCLGCVGDSTAVLGSCPDEEGEALHLTGDVSAEVLTERHWGRHEAERRRIEAGYAHCSKVLEDGYVKAIDGPLAGYEISVTRALGHLGMERHGVTAEPYVITRLLDANHCCLILASDGVWDHVTPLEAVNHVMDSAAEGRTAQEAAAALAHHACELGLTGPSGEQDNTSCAVLFLWAKEGEVISRRASAMASSLGSHHSSGVSLAGLAIRGGGGRGSPALPGSPLTGGGGGGPPGRDLRRKSVNISQIQMASSRLRAAQGAAAAAAAGGGAAGGAEAPSDPYAKPAPRSK